MRLFFGIEILEEIRDKMISFINSLNINSRNLKWVEKENLHLTLQFIGEVNSDVTSKLIELSSNIAFKEFKIDVSSFGGFPYLDKPNVLWIGVKEETNKLNSLQKEIQKACLKISNDIDTKPFHPHITIARVKGSLERNYIDDLKKSTNINFGSQIVNTFTLFSSTLTPNGPVYKIESKFAVR